MHELGVLGEALAAVAMPWLAHFLGHFVALVEARCHEVTQSHGCCSSMAAFRNFLFLFFFIAGTVLDTRDTEINETGSLLSRSLLPSTVV